MVEASNWRCIYLWLFNTFLLTMITKYYLTVSWFSILLLKNCSFLTCPVSQKIHFHECPLSLIPWFITSQYNNYQLPLWKGVSTLITPSIPRKFLRQKNTLKIPLRWFISQLYKWYNSKYYCPTHLNKHSYVH